MKKILDLKPGITDWASLTNFEQFESFTKAEDPDEAYLKLIRPLKLELQLYYRDNNSFFGDFKIIIYTVYKVFTRTRRLPKELSFLVNKFQVEHLRVSTDEQKLIGKDVCDNIQKVRKVQ